jgi:hypothetical protein
MIAGMITFLKNIEFSQPVRMLLVWLSAFVVLVCVAVFAWGMYMHARSEDEVRRVSEMFEGGSVSPAEEGGEVGGATPEATLALYIAALLKKDYETASRYFLPEARANELAELRASDTETIARTIDLLKHAEQGSYSFKKDAYTIREPIFVDFVRYQNGVWGIKEL